MAVLTMHATSFPRCSIVSLVYSTPLGLTWVACTRTGNSIANVNVTRQRISLLGRLNDNDGEEYRTVRHPSWRLRTAALDRLPTQRSRRPARMLETGEELA